ncbi:hypothetical protein ACWCQ0_51665 [Streptomyces massasporeus]
MSGQTTAVNGSPSAGGSSGAVTAANGTPDLLKKQDKPDTGERPPYDSDAT